MNELFLILSLVLIYGAVLVSYRLFGRSGLLAMTVIATIFANIEVLILVDAFGMVQTLGNVMFAATYLITDILSENEGEKYAARAVHIGIFTSVMMLLFTQYWFLYTPAEADWAAPAIREIFSTTPRLMLASLVGYIVSQRLDVWLYHRIWELTSKKSGNSRNLLWVRNNAATLISQILNTILFNAIAFFGMYEPKQLIGIMISSYVIYIFTSLLDTPAVYLARRMKEKGKITQM